MLVLALRLLILSLLMPFSALLAQAELLFSFESTPCCLPKTVRPLAYRVNLKPDVSNLTQADHNGDIEFQAEEEIDIEFLRPADTITLNAVALSFESSDVALDGELAIDVIFNKAKPTADIRFAHDFAAGTHKLTILYSGKIVPQPHGLYYADYETPSGKRRMLVTQFEATNARRMFPCWDEPVFKATVQLSAELPASFRAISNMPVIREEAAGEGKKKVFFAVSPKMSSYLTALIAGEFGNISGIAGAADIAVYAPAGRETLGAYALNAAMKLLPYYNDYFGVDYPLPKLDLIAIPNFAATAMENWGAITYIDSSLLFDPKDSTQSTKDQIFEVVAHEMAHQWSGNLVTMAWWDNLWLNEGFASWMQKKSTDFFNPSWKIWLSAHEQKEDAMALDARPATHPMQEVITEESKIDSAFDAINYAKGQAVIRMLEAYLGEDRFREGMRLYMKDHAYSNATAADLWAALEEASQIAVASIAKGFTEYPGVPLIHVETACVDGAAIVSLRQDRFTVHNPYAEPRTWRVPVTVGRISDSKPRKLIVGDEPKQIKFAGCGEPVMANSGGTGYYRVEYNLADFQALAGTFTRLSAADRVNFLSDAWAMVQAGRAEPQSYLDLMGRLQGETELAVWTRVIRTFLQIDDLERGAPGREAFRAFARSLLKPVLGRLGWEPKANEEADAPLDLLLRALVIKTLGRFGDQDVIGEARRRLAAFLDDPETLHKDLRDAVVAVAGYAADRKTFGELRDLGRRATATEAKLRYYYALAGAHDPVLIEEVINIALTDELPSGRVNRFLAFAANACDSPDRVWDLVLRNREPILKKLTTGQKQTLLPRIAMASSSPSVAFDLRWKTEESRVSKGARYEAGRAADEIEFKADFKERLLPQIEHWLKRQPD
jgi:aminopeptidase N